jgi:hypothetical protein
MSNATPTKTDRPEDLQIWRDEGHFLNIDGDDIFVHASGKPTSKGHGVLLTHGYPASSIDWKNVVPRVALHTRVVISDFLGFGQSDKPTDGTFESHYSMFKQADRVIAVAESEGLKEVVLCTSMTWVRPSALKSWHATRREISPSRSSTQSS